MARFCNIKNTLGNQACQPKKKLPVQFDNADTFARLYMYRKSIFLTSFNFYRCVRGTYFWLQRVIFLHPSTHTAFAVWMVHQLPFPCRATAPTPIIHSWDTLRSLALTPSSSEELAVNSFLFWGGEEEMRLPRDNPGGDGLGLGLFQPLPRFLGGILKSPRAYRIAETPPMHLVRKLYLVHRCQARQVKRSKTARNDDEVDSIEQFIMPL